jgi:glycosyltransferase involved in cell wall biosynthesis
LKKILFISNISNKISNFSIPAIEAGQSIGYDFHLAANYSNFKGNETDFNVRIHHIDIDRNPLSLKNLIAYKQMLRLIELEKFDVIHCNTPIGGLLGRICGKKMKVKSIIYTAHGFHFYKGSPLINWCLYYPLERLLSYWTDCLITINKEDYKRAMKFKLRKANSVYYVPGVGVNRFSFIDAKSKRQEILEEFGMNIEDILIISAGELNINKNNRVIINALGKLKNPKIHYLLCGEGNKKEELDSLIKLHGLEKNIHFLGYRDDIARLYKSCDIFVMPSYREGLSRSIMEAMSAGLPCLVSNIRGNSDLIKHDKGGYLFNPKDVVGFKKGIESLAESEKLRVEMGHYNTQAVKKFDIENVKVDIKEIYEKLLTDNI